jgi:hypothetical protein
LANIAFAFGTLPWMPERVAHGFLPSGEPTVFVSPIFYAFFWSSLAVATWILVLAVSRAMRISSTKRFCIPNPDYWLNEENRPKTIRRLCSAVERLGIATILLLMLLQWRVFKANQIIPPKINDNNLWVGVLLVVIIITVDIVYMLWSFRLPKEKER